MSEKCRIVNGLKLPPKRVVKLKKPDNGPKEWFYQHPKTGAETGPLSQSEVNSAINVTINQDTLMWKAGMQDWIKAEEIETFKGAFNKVRPLLPTSAVSDKWAWCLATIPLVAYWAVSAIWKDVGVSFVVGGVLCFVLNCIFAKKDEKVLEGSRRNIASSGLLILGCILVPVYLLVRAIKLGGVKKFLPFVVWCVLCFAPEFYDPIFDTDKRIVAPVVEKLLRDQFEEKFRKQDKIVSVESVDNIRLMRMNRNEYQGWADVVFKASGTKSVKLTLTMKVARDGRMVSISDGRFIDPGEYINWRVENGLPLLD